MNEPYYDYEDDDTCQRCGGEGFLMASDGDPSDWGEDTYCGDEDATITCRQCRGRGYLLPLAAPSTGTAGKEKE